MSTDRIVVHCIGNAHIDPVWRWPWQEGYTEVLATCRAAVDRLRETPDFVFSRGQAATYAWIQEADPALLDEIRRYVAEGRWSIVNGWWEQPDANAPCGESYVRHALYGKRWFRARLGTDVSVGWNVDTFGHNGGLPQILARAGFRAYCFFRPGAHEKDLPPFFWWEGPDGSRVLAIRPPVGHYGTGGGELKDHIRSAADRARELGMRHAVLFFGVGNHGGGPTRANVRSIQELARDPAEPEARFSTVEAFLEALGESAAGLPVVRGDLQHHAPGCYTTHAGIKAWNHDAEQRLLESERWCALATCAFGWRYPAPEFERAWRRVLFNQFHDILAGTSLPAAYADAREQIAAACADASDLQNRALQAFASSVYTTVDAAEPPAAAAGRPVLLFNPSSWDRADPVTVQWGWHAQAGGRLLDDEGREVPYQEVQPDVFGGAQRITFGAAVPAGGWRVYRFVPGDPTPEVGGPEAGGAWLRNRHWRVRVDPATGCVGSIEDVSNGHEYIDGQACALLVMEDPGDTWGHDIASWRSEVGRFGEAQLSVIGAGPVQATLRAESRFGRSTARQEFTLYRDSPRIDVVLTLDWQERGRFLKLSVPVALRGAALTCGIPYGVLVRDTTGAEDPFQGWLDLTGTPSDARGPACGLSLIVPGKFGYDCLGTDLRLSVVRSPIYCFHDPAKVEPGREYAYMDQGRHVIRYALLPHSGDWHAAGTVRHAEAFSSPLRYVFQYPHAGAWGRKGSLASVTPANVVLASLKGAEDGDDVIVRLLETAGTPASARVMLPGREAIEAALGPWELRTLRVSRDGSCREVSLLED